MKYATLPAIAAMLVASADAAPREDAMNLAAIHWAVNNCPDFKLSDLFAMKAASLAVSIPETEMTEARAAVSMAVSEQFGDDHTRPCEEMVAMYGAAN